MTIAYVKPVEGLGLMDLNVAQELVDTVNGLQEGDIAFETILVGEQTLAAAGVEQIDQSDNVEIFGVANQPTSGFNSVSVRRVGNQFRMSLTLTACRIPVTDAGVSGSFGSLKLFDFAEGAFVFQACKQNWTAAVEGAALTGAANDAAYVIGVGTTAISAAADAVLAAAAQNVGSSIAMTDPTPPTNGTATNACAIATAALDGTATPGDLYLNWSGSAATIDANSTIDMTGTIIITGAFLGDD